MLKNLPASAGNAGLVPGLGRSPGEGNGNPLWYSCLGNSMSRGAWLATVHRSQRGGHDLVTKTTEKIKIIIVIVINCRGAITYPHRDP